MEELLISGGVLGDGTAILLGVIASMVGGFILIMEIKDWIKGEPYRNRAWWFAGLLILSFGILCFWVAKEYKQDFVNAEDSIKVAADQEYTGDYKWIKDDTLTTPYYTYSKKKGDKKCQVELHCSEAYLQQKLSGKVE
jgi:hypothetical protein